ncbi:hypothetical protein A8C56_02605 [Niabella ginsenosidivorans]|uniref:Uncharacterized protein n=1 Tax=Niabella ginsenosidivorans TaxID=1176587 RepID=A0A1A9HXA3_9BACT|nr:hypothetical protein A8C56_02605 [Niabella ginsenosidivorans]
MYRKAHCPRDPFYNIISKNCFKGIEPAITVQDAKKSVTGTFALKLKNRMRHLKRSLNTVSRGIRNTV